MGILFIVVDSSLLVDTCGCALEDPAEHEAFAGSDGVSWIFFSERIASFASRSSSRSWLMRSVLVSSAGLDIVVLFLSPFLFRQVVRHMRRNICIYMYAYMRTVVFLNSCYSFITSGSPIVAMTCTRYIYYIKIVTLFTLK